MSGLFSALPADFMASFIAGIGVNFEIACLALAFGLGLGLALSLACLRRGALGRAAAASVALMRAAPTFVVMFFLMNALPRSGLSGVTIVALSLVPYAAAYAVDCGVDALKQYRAGSPLACLLVLPNLTRAFFVLVMSSSAGAAIGVNEGIAIILHQAEKMPDISGKLLLFAIGVACFGIPLQAGFALVRLVQRRLGRLALSYRPVMPVDTAAAATRHSP